MSEAVLGLMPWRAAHDRRLGRSSGAFGEPVAAPVFCRRSGSSPKVLQRTLRFQGFLALGSSRRGCIGTAWCGRDGGSRDGCRVRRPGASESRMSPVDRSHADASSSVGRRSLRLRARSLRLVQTLPCNASPPAVAGLSLLDLFKNRRGAAPSFEAWESRSTSCSAAR